jgi:CBS domain-containing protein
MLAHTLVDSFAPYVTRDTDAREVARLIGGSGGAVSVVDENFEPIGIVTRGNLARLGMLDDTQDVLGAPPIFLLRAKAPPALALNGLLASDVMSAPAIVAPATAKVVEIARIMESHRINYLPLVREGRYVGIVRRADVFRAMSGGGETTAARAGGVTAAEFRGLVQAHEKRELAERSERRRSLLALRDQRVKELAQRRLSDSRWREMLSRARSAAAAGLKEYMLIRFPSQLCSDGGRAINAPDPGWPHTLRGEPADVFLRWSQELEPNGFRLGAQIIEFPDGMPGDAALFLMWGG